MKQAVVEAILLLVLGGTVLASLRSLMGKTRTTPALIRTLRYGIVAVVLSTLIGQGCHHHTTVLYCCFMGAVSGQLFKDRSRLERGVKGACVLLVAALAWFGACALAA